MRFAFLPVFALALLCCGTVEASGGGGATAADRLAVARDWVATHPDDADTLRFMGRQLHALERYPEAAEALARADRHRPDDPDPVTHLATLLRLGRMDDARVLAAAAEDRLDAPGAAPRSGTLRLVAEAMVAAGEFGRARLLLDTALAQAPADVALLVERAGVETAARRPVRALAYLEKAVALAPLDAAANRALVRALNGAGMPVRAVRAFEAAAATGLAMDEGLLVAALGAHQAYGAHRAAIDLADAHVDRFRKSAPLLRAMAVSLAALGAGEHAVERLRQALALAPPDQAVLDLLRTGLPEDRREPLLRDLRRRFPWIADLFATGGKPPRDQPWPWLREAATMDRAAAAAHLARGVAELPSRQRGGRAALLLRLADLEPDPDAALARLDGADALDAPRGSVQAGRTRVLAAAGRWDAAAVAAWEWARTRPDDADAVAALFQPEIGERLGWARVFAHLHDHVQRDPEAADRRLRALSYHAGTGGSAVLALAHAQALERMPDGDHAEGRRLRSLVTRGLDAVGRLVDMDFARARAVLETPEGRLEVECHPVTGRLLRFSLADHWIAAEWSADGLDLVALADGKGNRLEAGRRDGRLTVVEARGEHPFRAEIGPDGVPTSITAPGGDAGRAAEAYNAGLALLAAWPRTGVAGARWLKIGP